MNKKRHRVLIDFQVKFDLHVNNQSKQGIESIFNDKVINNITEESGFEATGFSIKIESNNL